MIYRNIIEGTFLERPNRFIAICEINGQKENVHVKNTGRCKELLVKGAKVYLEKSDNENRKTKYDLISVKKGDKLINMDSQVPNELAKELVEKLFKPKYLKREHRYKNSRFDLYFETDKEKAYLEVKGVTLEKDGIVMFPDAPTERGVKHINELCQLKKEGFGAYILFVVQLNGVKYFTPNEETHKEFAVALRNAKKQGVKIMAYDCIVTKDSITIDSKVEVKGV